MNPAFFALLFKLATDAPHLIGEATQLYADIAHGEGGLAKVQKAVADVNAIVASIGAAS